MNRCHKTGARLAAAMMFAALAGTALSLLPSIAGAQSTPLPTMQRTVPQDVLLGRMVITAPPVIVLNGKVDRLSPGSRIRDLNNMMVLSGGLVNLNLPVVYKRDGAGLVHEVWILTNEEFSKLAGINTTDAIGIAKFGDQLVLMFNSRP